LIAVGRDSNDQYFPLAFGVVETETKESWRWFIQLLLEDVGQHNRFVFISDQQKVKMFYSIAYHNVFFFVFLVLSLIQILSLIHCCLLDLSRQLLIQYMISVDNCIFN
jgi:hypothetical protein